MLFFLFVCLCLFVFIIILVLFCFKNDHCRAMGNPNFRVIFRSFIKFRGVGPIAILLPIGSQALSHPLALKRDGTKGTNQQIDEVRDVTSFVSQRTPSSLHAKRNNEISKILTRNMDCNKCWGIQTLFSTYGRVRRNTQDTREYGTSHFVSIIQ